MMDILQWLTENPVAIGAVIGAAGSVVAQLIAAILNFVAGASRAKGERAEKARDREAAERERFDANRREAFVRILQQSAATGWTLHQQPGMRVLDELEPELEALAQDIEVVSLIAPSAYASCVRVYKELSQARDLLMNEGELSPTWWEGLRNGPDREMRVAMRATLRESSDSDLDESPAASGGWRLCRKRKDRTGA